MFRSSILALVLALQVGASAPAASPQPTPTSQCAAAPGMVKYCGVDVARYFVPSGPIHYLDFRRPSAAVASWATGSIIGYSVLDEHHADIPSVVVLFYNPDAREVSAVYLAHPVTIDGRPFVCPSAKTSDFARMYQVCPALPTSISGLSHPVKLSIYPVRMPDGTTVNATDAITTLR